MGKKKVAAPKDAEKTEGTTPSVKSVKKSKRIEHGRVYINATYNNTVVSVTDEQGGVLAWATAGSLGFAGPKKATPFAASKIISILGEKMKAIGMKEVDIYIRGIGGGRDSAVRSIINQGFEVASLHDVTPVPHNGPRPAKVRRV